MYNIQKSKGVIYMKKVLFLLMILFGAFNSFSAHILNGKNSGMFTDKEMMSLVSGNYNTDVQLAVVSKARGSNQESTTKAENDARLTLQTTIKEYSYLVLTSYLKETGVTGQNFDVKKMKDIADQIAKEALLSATQKGKWITGRNDTVMLYLIEKETVRKMSAKAFRERLTNLIEKLTEYRGVFETLKIPGGN
jgi:hypothetical protein